MEVIWVSSSLQTIVGSLQCRSRNSDNDKRMEQLVLDWIEAVWCTMANKSFTGSVHVSDGAVPRKVREEGFKALGVWITFDGHCTNVSAECEVAACRKLGALQQVVQRGGGVET